MSREHWRYPYDWIAANDPYNHIIFILSCSQLDTTRTELRAINNDGFAIIQLVLTDSVGAGNYGRHPKMELIGIPANMRPVRIRDTVNLIDVDISTVYEEDMQGWVPPHDIVQRKGKFIKFSYNSRLLEIQVDIQSTALVIGS